MSSFSVWTRIHPILEPIVQEALDDRLYDEICSREAGRWSIVNDQYRAYWSTRSPSTLVFYPKETELYNFDLIAPFLSRDEDYLPNQGFRALMAELFANEAFVAEMEAWVTTRKVIIMSTLPVAPAPCSSFTIPPELELAKNVFVGKPWDHSYISHY